VHWASAQRISPFAPGGSTTYTARLIGQQLTDAWGQQVVVDNRPGANTVIGTRLAATSPPDGYTLLVASSALAGNHTLVKTPYDALKDLVMIASVMSYESVLVDPTSMPVKRVKDLVAMAKAKPGQITFGTSSSGGTTHMLTKPETRQILTKLGFEPFYNTPEKTAAILTEDIAAHARIIKAANIEAER